MPLDTTHDNAAIAAIRFAVEHCGLEAREFLHLWMYGEFEAIRKEWPECPTDVFIGADPLLDSSHVLAVEDANERVKSAERQVQACLNYGGVFVGGTHTNQELELVYQQGDLKDEVPQMRRFASALNNLADALDAAHSVG